jgi:hypothetical protein
LQAFDDVLRGMKKTGQRVAIIATALYSIEVVRVCYLQKKQKCLFFFIKISLFLIRLNEKKKYVVLQ